VGSLFCGLSQDLNSFSLLLVARAVQAIGGGGILPIATAEFGTAFPPEKRGMALGLVGGVYGIANIFGASVGSAIISIFGQNNWQFIFYVNIPITLFIVAAGVFTLRNNKPGETGKIDGLGILTLVAMILSLLYGLKNLDFFNIGGTVGSTSVYPFLAAFAALIPVFIVVEKRAQDPVMNLGYFSNRNIVLTLFISFVSGFVLMGVIFIPQFSENALKIATGSGGYLVIILGLFSGFGAPISGKLIDKFGAKVVLGFGFLMSIAGAMFLVLVTTAHPNLLTVLISLALIGTGMGFTIGTPLNYMMLANTEEKESNSALATLSLVRSIGTAVAPAIMVGFLAHAGASLQTDVMKLLPKDVSLPKLSYAQEISDTFNQL
jgi:MFS family permease